jgi:hypothetical protein
VAGGTGPLDWYKTQDEDTRAFVIGFVTGFLSNVATVLVFLFIVGVLGIKLKGGV